MEALATRRNAVLVLLAAGVVALAVFALRPTYPNYDSYYTLIWGDQLASGDLPDYDVFRTPTPHPLATALAAVLSLAGESADRLLVLISLGFYIGLLAALFRFTQLLLGTLVAAVGVAILLTRTDLEFFALRAVVDVPFLTLVFAAAVMELRRPRRGWPVLAVLGLAGLVRPEAWALSGAYLIWLALPDRWLERLGASTEIRDEASATVPKAAEGKRLAGLAAFAAAAPIVWLLADLAVTGDPLYSITSTREVAGQFGRQRSLPEAVGQIPDYVGGNEKIVNVVAGGLGLLAALWVLRRRAALPLAIMAIGVAVFLAIAAVGLSVIPRYLIVPSLLFNLGVAVALTSPALVGGAGPRRLAVALMVVALLLVAWRAPSYVRDLRRLNGSTLFVQEQHRDLKALLEHPRVVPLLRACGPITVPTHSAIPVIRWATGLGKESLVASIEQRRPPERGLLLVGPTFNFEPAAARSTAGTSARSAQKWWSNYPLSTFRPVARNERWRAYARCP